MNKYIELKKIIEEFLELRKETRKKKELQESNNISLIYYLYIINCVVYNNEYYEFSNDFSQHIKEEIRK